MRLGPIAVSPFELHPLKMASSLLTLNEVAKRPRADRRGRRRRHGDGDGRDAGAPRARGARVRRNHPGRSLRQAGEVPRRDLPGALVQPALGRKPGASGLRRRERAADAANPPRAMPTASWSAISCPATWPGPATSSTNPCDAHGRDRASFPLNNFWAWHVKESQEEAERESRIWLAVRGTIYPKYIGTILDDDESGHRQCPPRRLHQGLPSQEP